MSIRDAAQATGLSPKALRRRIERGTLTSVMIGGRRRIPMEALARRGLIVTGHDTVMARRLVERDGIAAEAVQDRLRRLESRVSALEAVLETTLDGAGHANADDAALARFGAGQASLHAAGRDLSPVGSADGTGVLSGRDGRPAPPGVDAVL